MMEVSGRDVPIEHAPERPGELQHSALDVSRLRAAGWEQQADLNQGLAETYQSIAGVAG